MEPVQFPCNHCGKLMAVGSEDLGQQVRCPHCQQVVVAPPPALMPGPAETPLLGTIEAVLRTPVEDADHIFSPVEATEDLFGRSDAPRIELPPEPPAALHPNNDAASPPEVPAAVFASMPWAPPEATAAPPPSFGMLAPSDSTAAPPPDGVSPWPAASITDTLAPPPAELPPPGDAPLVSGGEPSLAGGRTRKRTEQNAPWFLLLVFCPLLLYAIVISIFAFFLYRNYQQLKEHRNPFDAMPDVGDDPGVHKGKKVSLTDRYKPELATLPMPDHLCTTLGNPIRIGDLQVTPERVERKRIFVKVGNSRAEPCRNDSLVLYLDLKNLSTEYAFAPLDNYFDRYWRPGQDQIPPLTQLEIGSRYRCYGGPARWYPRGHRNPRQWIEGRHDDADLLRPGEQKESFVCTDGDDAKAEALLFGGKPGETYRGSLLWRVRVRRGPVHFQGKDYSATAVIGVRFTDADIQKAASEVH